MNTVVANDNAPDEVDPREARLLLLLAEADRDRPEEGLGNAIPLCLAAWGLIGLMLTAAFG